MIDDKTLDSKEYKAIFCDIFDTVVYRTVQPEFTKKLWASKIVKRLELNLNMINLYNKLYDGYKLTKKYQYTEGGKNGKILQIDKWRDFRWDSDAA
jgi:hypothetical protein